ncbi:uncharacterized protein [Littorina saxatilis]|uniref:Uncharacterized protein n=1 Tax=Littorina saxatilis TaxID=31220 RepID=A0AAN9B7B1_9CAEN
MLPEIMAVNGPPNPDVGLVEDFNNLPSGGGDPQYSPTLGTVSIPVSPPPTVTDSPSKSPGPVSPGKKRVRISDSASVRVIEDHHSDRPQHRSFHFNDNSQNNNNNNNNNYSLAASYSPRSRRELKFNGTNSVGEHHKGSSSSPRAREYNHDDAEREYCNREYHDGEYEEYTESIVSVDQLTFPDQVPPTPVEKSLESRDNPFLPGGDLSKEAEELLKKATIVRDKFYLNQEGKYVQHSSPEHYDPSKAHHPTGDTSYDAADGTLLANANNNNAAAAAAAVLEERISPSSASKAQAGIAPAPGEAVPRVNGKAGDGVVGGTSPDGVRLEVGGSPTADGSRGVGNDNAGAAPGVGGDQQDKDKAKRRPKCCTVM